VGPQTGPQPGPRRAAGVLGARSRLVVGPRHRQHRLSRHPPFQRQYPVLPAAQMPPGAAREIRGADDRLARGDPVLHAEALGRGSGTARPLPARTAHRPDPAATPEGLATCAPSSWPKNSRAERSRPRPQGSGARRPCAPCPNRRPRPRPVEPPALAVPRRDPRQHRDQRHGGELGVGTAKTPAACPAFQHRLQPVLVVAPQPLDHREILRASGCAAPYRR
jgi:hypothetical protein